MIITKNSNSDFCVLVLARPADSMCATLAVALRQWGYVFSIHATAYDIINAAKNLPAAQSVILIARPAMLGFQAAVFIERHFPNLQIIGWIDSGENIADCAIAQTTVNGMTTASHLDQLQQIIHRLYQSRASCASDTDAAEKIDRLEYELSDDEVNALLGVE